MPRSTLSETGLAKAVLAAVISFLLAGLIWLVAIGSAQGTLCPAGAKERGLAGLETPRSLWPPGVECTTKSANGPVESVVEGFAGATAAVIALLAVGIGVLLLGTAVAIRRLRSPDHAFPSHAASVN